MKTTLLASLIGIAVFAGCGNSSDFRCRDDSNCDLASGGKCVAAATGNMWCAYPDLGCASGLRFSDSDVGDDLAGTCTAAGRTFKLTVTVSGGGSGQVASIPAGVDCSMGACTYDFPEGATVQLKSTTSDDAFLGWSGECSGFSACTVTMDQDRAVSALFGVRGQPLWVKQVGDAQFDGAYSLAADSDGNIIASGYFEGTVILGSYTLTSNAASQDIFLVKLNSQTGDVMWARSFGGTNAESARGLALDALNGIYVVGEYQQTAIFSSTIQISAVGQTDMFVAKFAADGNPVWARSVGGSSFDAAAYVAVRGSQVAMAGTFRQGVAVNNSTYVSAGFTDVFVALLTTDGDYIWTKALGGSQFEHAGGLAIDSSGNVIAAGSFGSATLDAGGSALSNASSPGVYDIWLAKYAGATGAHLFSKRFGSANAEVAAFLTVDPNNNIIMNGLLLGSVDFGGPTPLTPVNAVGDVFLVKLTAAGAYQWGKVLASTGDTSAGQIEHASVIATNAAGDVAMTGYFCGTMSLGGSSLSSASACGQPLNLYDVYAVRFNAAGVYQNSVRVGGSGNEYGNGVAFTSDGRYFISGEFEGFSDFGTGQTLTSKGKTDAFFLGLAPL